LPTGLYPGGRFQLVRGDIRGRTLVEQAVDGVDAIVHLAGIVGDPACAADLGTAVAVNLHATIGLRKAAQKAGTGQFVFASSCSVYGHGDQLIDEATPPRPLSLYAETKLDAETDLLGSGLAVTDTGGYQHGHLGFNYRMTGLHAAVGLAQMERLDALLATKRRIRDRYRQHLASLPGLSMQQDAPAVRSTGWLATILLDSRRFGVDAAALRTQLDSAGIDTGAPWTPLHRTGAHTGCAPRPCPIAERLGRDSLHLPCSTTLTVADQDRVITAIRAAARPAAGHPLV
jgi:hypothetical protein